MSSSRFGPFEIIRKLGAGGVGHTALAVWRPYVGNEPIVGQVAFDKCVCLKRLQPQAHQSEHAIAQWRDEVAIAAALQHQKIVSLLAWGREEGEVFWAYDFVDGIDLRQMIAFERITGATLPVPFVIRILSAIADALHYAHGPELRPIPDPGGSASVDLYRPGIVHRDLSPENVMVSRHGEVMITDFTWARVLDDQPINVFSNNALSKLEYTPPERIRTPSLRDARGDLFAIGIIAYELLTTRRPYKGRSESECIANAERGEHQRVSELQPRVSPGLEAIVHRLIVPDPSARFGSAAELIEALHALPDRAAPAKWLGELVCEIVPRDPPPADRMQHRIVVGSGAPKPRWIDSMNLLDASLAPPALDAPGSDRAGDRDQRLSGQVQFELPAIDVASLEKDRGERNE